ncbi:MAG: RNA polymerase factor sigma-54 [Betaproteobacteria bacterium]|nr:RNA polymerase factor sigma-54 [Betaproteobacteria bacterium]
MKPSLQFRLSQHLTLTPQLQQSIRLLQLSTVELNQEIERMLMDNPVLEREDADDGTRAPAGGGNGDAAPAEPQTEPLAEAPEADWSGEPPPNWRSGDDNGDTDRSYSAPDSPTLRDHLIAQLGLTNLPRRDRALVEILIDALDDDGYLTQDLEEIIELLPPEEAVDPQELSTALKHLQNLEPAGVGARTPSECLALQLRARGNDDAVARIGLEVVEKHLDALAAHDYNRLRSATGADDEQLRAAQLLIQSLDPHPGASFSNAEARYLTPDVVVRKTKGVWRASLNREAMPRLRINRLYAELAASRGGASGFASQMQEARWMIKNVQQRFDTILRVAQAIVDRQRHFFEHGDVAMRPMVLREIADALGLHESTISRVTTQKYMATPRGTFELKYFFGSHVATDAGGACSATAIRALIKQLVAAEDAQAPLSDASISQILGQQGIVVARRTIAKYREALHIPPLNLRKSL